MLEEKEYEDGRMTSHIVTKCFSRRMDGTFDYQTTFVISSINAAQFDKIIVG